MNITGITIAVITFSIIGLFHPVVIWAEYHFSKKVWPVFLAVGLVFLALSVLTKPVLLSSALAVVAAGCFWSIPELWQQEKRVQRGWFPKKPDRKA